MALSKKNNAIKLLQARRATPAPATPAPATPAPATPAAEPNPLPIPGRKPRARDRSIFMLDPLLLDKEGKVIARIADISLDGALLYSRGAPFPVGTELSGWLDSPALGAFDEEFVAVWFTVAWTRKEGSNGWFKAGCSFENVEEAEKKRLASLINALKVTPS